jgi:hypothetical protein
VGTVEEQLASLRRAVESIHAELDGLRTGQTALRAELLARLERLEAAQDELRRTVEAQQDERSRLDARGVPLAAVGALLAGWPAAWLPWWWATALLLVAGIAAVAAVGWLRSGPGKPGAWAEVRAGWLESRQEGRPAKPTAVEVVTPPTTPSPLEAQSPAKTDSPGATAAIDTPEAEASD